MIARARRQVWTCLGFRPAGFRDARPITERAPWLVTAALVAVAAVLGALAL